MLRRKWLCNLHDNRKTSQGKWKEIRAQWSIKWRECGIQKTTQQQMPTSQDLAKPFCLWKTSLACLEHCNRGSSWGGREEKDIVKMKLWLKGAKQIVQVVDKGQPFLTGEAMKRLALLEDEDGLSIIVDGYTIYDVSSVLLCMHNLLSSNQEIKWSAN